MVDGELKFIKNLGILDSVVVALGIKIAVGMVIGVWYRNVMI